MNNISHALLARSLPPRAAGNNDSSSSKNNNDISIVNYMDSEDANFRDGNKEDVNEEATFVEVPGLKRFETVCQPRKLLPEAVANENGQMSSTEVVVSSEDLGALLKHEFQCLVCQGPLRKTLTVTSCLHRYCNECLKHVLRMELGPASANTHSCPACRVKLASHRASKQDTEYDQLLQVFHSAVREAADEPQQQQQRSEEDSDHQQPSANKRQRKEGVVLLNADGSVFTGSIVTRKLRGAANSTGSISADVPETTAAGASAAAAASKKKQAVGQPPKLVTSALAAAGGAEEDSWLTLAQLRELHEQKVAAFKAKSSKLDATIPRNKRSFGGAVKAAEIAAVQSEFRSDSRSSASNLQKYQQEHHHAIRCAKKSPRVWLSLSPDSYQWKPDEHLQKAMQVLLQQQQQMGQMVQNTDSGFKDHSTLELQNPFLKVPLKKTVGDLKKYLLKKLHSLQSAAVEDAGMRSDVPIPADAVRSTSDSSGYTSSGGGSGGEGEGKRFEFEVVLLIDNDSNLQELGDLLTISQVTEQFWNRASELSLLFRLFVKS